MRIIVATRNNHKVAEIKSILSDPEIELFSLRDIQSHIDLQETGMTFQQNAEEKARLVASHIDEIVLADDSGLEVDALNGLPGVFSARYSGPDATDSLNNQRLLDALKGIPWQRRRARYRCIIALIDLEKRLYFSEGTCKGIIAFEPAGENGFGYDPLFYVPEYKMTMAQLAPGIKNRISHRARALENIKRILKFDINKGD